MATTKRKTVKKTTAAKKTAAAKKNGVTNKTTQIVIPRPRRERLLVEVKGVGPLVCKAWSPDVIDQMERVQTGKAGSGGRGFRDPKKEWNGGRYLHKIGGKMVDCVKGVHFRKSIATAAKDVEGIYATTVDRNIFVLETFIPLKFKGKEPDIFRDIVWVGKGKNKSPMPSWRPMYHDWSCKFTVEFDATIFTAEQIASLLDRAGYSCGICEGRPERGSGNNWGRFAITKVR